MNNRRKFSKRLKVLFSIIVILFITLVTLLLLYFLQGDVKVINPNPYDSFSKNITKVENEKDSYILKVDDYYFNNSKKDAPLSFLSLYDSSISNIQFNQNIEGDKDKDKDYKDITYDDIYANILENKEVVLTIDVKRFIGRTRQIKIKFDFSNYTFAYLNGDIVVIENINSFPEGSKKREEKALEFASNVLKKFPAFSWYKDKSFKKDSLVNLNYYSRVLAGEILKGYDIYSTEDKKRVDFLYDVELDLVNPNAYLPSSIAKKRKIKDGEIFQRPVQDPELKGYTFAGWYDLDGKEFDFTKPIQHDTVLFAKWNIIRYQIEYVNDGDKIENITSYTIEDQDIVLKNGTKFGYTFDGWSEDNGATKIVDFTIKKGTIGSKNLKAFYSPNSYNIEYEFYNVNKNKKIEGQSNPEQEVIFDSNFSLNYRNIEDYVFVNFTYFEKDGTEKVLTSDYTESIKYIWDHNLRIRINYTQNIAELHFESGEFATNNPESIQLVEGSYVPEPKAPIRKGYTFKGWYDLPQTDGLAPRGYRLDFPYALIKTITAYAKWEINRYQILFNPLGGQWPTNEDTIILRNESQEQVYPIYANYNDIIQTSPRVKRFGYTFQGWFTTSDFRPDSQIFKVENGVEQNYKVVKNENVYAKWQANLINITFINTDPNNQETITQSNKEYEEKYQFPIPRERTDGYEFVGWSLDDTNTTTDADVYNVKDLTFAQTSQEPLKLYSIWAFQSYKISIDTRGGTPVNDSEYNIIDNQIIAKYNQTIKLPTVKDKDLKLTTKPGYNFAGWYLDDEVTPTQEDNVIKYAFTILAKWEIITDYKLKYSAIDILNPTQNLEGVNWQGKFTEDQPKEESYTVEEEKELPSLSKVGYKFLGWTVKQHPTNESHTQPGVQQNIDKMIPHLGYTVYKGTYGTKEFVANFIPNTYQVTYNFNNEQKTILTANVKYNDKFNLILPERVGYKFVGWKYNADVYNEQALPEGSFTYTYTFDVTLTAQWEKVTFEVVYLDDIDIQVYSEKYEYGALLDTTEAEKEGRAYKPGYILIDWKLHTGKDIIRPYHVYESTVLKARYKKRFYTLTYDEGSVTPKEQYGYYDNITTRTPRETDANRGKKFLGYFFRNKEGEEEKLSSNYAYDFDIVAVPKFEAQYYTVIVNLNGGENPRFKESGLPIENYQFKVLNGDTIKEITADKKNFEIANWFFGNSTSNVVKFPYKVTGVTYLRPVWARKLYKIKIVNYDNGNTQPHTVEVQAGSYYKFKTTQNNENKYYYLKGIYYLEDENDKNSKKYIPSSLFYDFEKNLTVYYEYEKRRVNVKFILDPKPADKEEKIARGEDPYPYYSIMRFVGDTLEKSELEKINEISDATMSSKNNVMYTFKGWSYQPHLGVTSYNLQSFPITLSQSMTLYPIYVPKTYKIEYYDYNSDGKLVLKAIRENNLFDTNQVVINRLESDTDKKIFSHYLLGGQEQDIDPSKYPEELPDKSNVVNKYFKYVVSSEDEIKTIRLYPVYKSFNSYIKIYTDYSEVNDRGVIFIATKFNELIESQEVLIEKIKNYYQDQYENINPGFEINFFARDTNHLLGLKQTFPLYVNRIITMSISWKPRLYTLTYNHNYQVDGADVKEEYPVANSQIVNKIIPVREGYTFDGWYYDKEFKEIATDGSYGKAVFKLVKDTEVYAKWNERSYYIQINNYAVVDESINNSFKPSESITVPAKLFRENHQYVYDYIGLQDLQTGEIVAHDEATNLGKEYVISFEKYKRNTTFDALYRPRLINLKINRINSTTDTYTNIPVSNSSGYFNNYKHYKLSKDYETYFKDELDNTRFVTLKKGRFIAAYYLQRYFIKDKDIELDEVEPTQNSNNNYYFKIIRKTQNEQLNGYITENSTYNYNINITQDIYAVDYWRGLYPNRSDRRQLYDFKSFKIKYEGDSDFTRTLTEDEIKKFVYKTNLDNPEDGYLIQYTQNQTKKITEIELIFDYKTYNITYDLQGGTEDPTSPLPKQSKYVEQQTIGVPKKENYVFSYWSFNINLSLSNNYKTLPKKALRSDVTFTANWNPVNFNITRYDGFSNNKLNGPTKYSNIPYKSIQKIDYPNRVNDYSLFLGWELYDSASDTPLTEVYFPDEPDVNKYDSLKEYKGRKFIGVNQEFIFNYTKDIKAYAVYRTKIHKIKFHTDSDTTIKVLKNELFKLSEEGKSYEESEFVPADSFLDKDKIYLFEMKDSFNPLATSSNAVRVEKPNYQYLGFDTRVQRSRELDKNFESIYRDNLEDFTIIGDPEDRYNKEPNYDKPLSGFDPGFQNHYYSQSSYEYTFIKQFQNSLFIHAYPKLVYSTFTMYLQNVSDSQYFNKDYNVSDYHVDINPLTFSEFDLPKPERVGYKFLGYSLNPNENENLFVRYTQTQLDAFLQRANLNSNTQNIYPKFEKLSHNLRVRELHSITNEVIKTINNVPLSQTYDLSNEFTRVTDDLREIQSNDYYAIRQYNQWNNLTNFSIRENTYLTGETVDVYLNYVYNTPNFNFSTLYFNNDELSGTNDYLNNINTNYIFNSYTYYDIFAMKNNEALKDGMEFILYPSNENNKDLPSGYVFINERSEPIDENGVKLGDKVLKEHIKPRLFITKEVMKKMFELKNSFRIAVVLEKKDYVYYYHNLVDDSVTEIKADKDAVSVTFTNEQNPFYDSRYYYDYSNESLTDTYSNYVSKMNKNVHIYNVVTPKSFSIQYTDINGAIYYSLPSTYYTNQTSYVENIAKIGYIFEGWKVSYDGEDFQDEPIKDLKITPELIYNRYNKPLNKPLYLKAVFRDRLINVTFDYGYNNKIEKRQVRLNENITIPDSNQVGDNPGYNFITWTENTLGDYNNSTYQVIKQYDLYFKAKWDNIKVILNFMHDNQIIDQDYIRQYNHNNESFRVLETVYKPVIDEKDLHISSVYIQTTTGRKEIAFPYVINESDLLKQGRTYLLNIHIEKQPNYYDLLYDYDGGYEDPDHPNPLAFKLITDGDKTITIHRPLKFGSDFIGYTIDGLEPDPILNLRIDTTAHRKNLIIRANWKPKSQIVTFDQIYGVNERTKTVVVPYGYKVARPKDPNHFGYTFVHWYTDDMFVPFRFENTNIRKDITIKALYQRHISVVSVDYEKDKPNTIILNFGEYIPNFANFSYNKSVLDKIYEKVDIPVDIKPTLVEPVNNRLEFTFDTKDIYDNMILTFKKGMPIFTFIDQQARATGLLSQEIKVVYYDKKFTTYIKATSFEVPNAQEHISFNEENQAKFYVTVQNSDATVVPTITGFDKQSYKLELVDRIRSINQFEYRLTRLNPADTNDLVINVSVPELDQKSFTIYQQ